MLLPDIVSLAARATKRILTLDIETSPEVVNTFRLKTDYIAPSMIIEHGRVICWAAKWLDRKKVMFASDHHDGHQAMIEGAWDLLDSCDVLVTYNGRSFDIKHLKREFLLAGLPPPRPHKDVDLIQTVRRQFAFASNSLNFVSQRLGIGEKIKHEGFDLWRLCLAGDDAAWARMKRYNVGDVKLTESLYLELRPWITQHPPVTVMEDGAIGCNRCGSTSLVRLGMTLAVVIEYALYRCEKCNGLSRAGHSRRITATRAL